MGGAEVEGVIDDVRSKILYVRLPKLKMQKADARPTARKEAKKR